jgi:sporulation protein YlmC with PRC-barrel domain
MDDAAEPTNLIAGSKVTGTDVFNKDAEIVGKVHDMTLDKRSGQIVYVVISFGGLLGLGENYYPIPWRLLVYSPALRGYVVDLTRAQIAASPGYADGQDPNASPEILGSEAEGYWGEVGALA